MVSDPLSLDASSSAQQAGGRLADPDVRAVLVCDDGALLGSIAEPPIYTLDADESLDVAFHELEERDLERVPVTESGRLVGILSRAVVRRRLAEDEPPIEEAV